MAHRYCDDCCEFGPVDDCISCATPQLSLASRTRPLYFSGVDRRGTARTGSSSARGETATELTERLYAYGFREATVTTGPGVNEGDEVGWVWVLDGERTWCAEAVT